MNLFNFVKEAGEKLIDLLTPGNANADDTERHIKDVGLISPNIQVELEGDHIVVASGQAATQEEKEKVLLALGNIQGIESVKDLITLPASASTVPAARFVTVKSGDTLSKIAKEVYGDANKYNKIFEANKPMLSSPDKIYPGQVLRIPE